MAGYINNSLSIASLGDGKAKISPSQMVTSTGLNVTSCRFAPSVLIVEDTNLTLELILDKTFKYTESKHVRCDLKVKLLLYF